MNAVTWPQLLSKNNGKNNVSQPARKIAEMRSDTHRKMSVAMFCQLTHVSEGILSATDKEGKFKKQRLTLLESFGENGQHYVD